MAKRTKTQEKKLYQSIMTKAFALYYQSRYNSGTAMSSTDFFTIEKICKKYLKKF